MSRVDVYSRSQAEGLEKSFRANGVKHKTAVISITHDPDERIFWLAEDLEVLHLEFYDLSGPSLAYPDAQLFDPGLAKKVREFVFAQPAETRFLVHCAAGISRSVAVGLWISETRELPLHLHATWDTSKANSLVLAELHRLDWEATFGRPRKK